jgi:hypothetical protein
MSPPSAGISKVFVATGCCWPRLLFPLATAGPMAAKYCMAIPKLYIGDVVWFFYGKEIINIKMFMN